MAPGCNLTPEERWQKPALAPQSTPDAVGVTGSRGTEGHSAGAALGMDVCPGHRVRRSAVGLNSAALQLHVMILHGCPEPSPSLPKPTKTHVPRPKVSHCPGFLEPTATVAAAPTPTPLPGPILLTRRTLRKARPTLSSLASM